MAKAITFTSLKLKNNIEEPKIVKILDKDIEVKQYLPIEEKLNIIGNILNMSLDDNGFVNPVKIEVCANIEILKGYTNITFTDKQLEDVAKLYDILETNGIFELIIAAVPETEYNSIVDNVTEISENYYRYRNSFLGILENIKSEYTNMDDLVGSIEEKISNKENLTLLKDVITKLG